MLGYTTIIESSQAVTEDDLRRYRGDKRVRSKFNNNVLQDVFLCLVKLLETDSEESQSLQKDKAARGPIVVYAPPSTPPPASVHSFSSPLPYAQPRLPQSFETVNHNKRKLRDTSFGNKSTETTPTKLKQPEPNVQFLQDTFINRLLNKLWDGQVSIPWARGRFMFLTYSEYAHAVPL